MNITYAWRGDFDNEEVNRLHSEGFSHPVLGDDWRRQTAEHSLGWACARDDMDALVGFVNVPWDGATHAFIMDTLVAVRAAPRHRNAGLSRSALRRPGELDASGSMPILTKNCSPFISALAASCRRRPA
jgi:hypothetical protein